MGVLIVVGFARLWGCVWVCLRGCVGVGVCVCGRVGVWAWLRKLLPSSARQIVRRLGSRGTEKERERERERRGEERRGEVRRGQ